MTIPNLTANLELAQIGWVVPDIQAAIQFLTSSLGLKGFPAPEHVRAQDLNMNYYGKMVAGEWLTSQTYNGSAFLELIQPMAGQSMFHDYLVQHLTGGIQHLAYRLPVRDFDQITGELHQQGYALISEVNHPIARMAFFDTYQILGVATEIMGITEGGWQAIEQMKNSW